jgi:lipoate synthase
VPDFRGRVPVALEQLQTSPVDIFNHNLETIPRLYKQARPDPRALAYHVQHHKKGSVWYKDHP